MIDQTFNICEGCNKRRATEWHHIIPRNELKGKEKTDKKFQVHLCHLCHVPEFHNSKDYSGWRWFKKRLPLFVILLNRCGRDKRFLKRAIPLLEWYNEKDNNNDMSIV